MYFFYFAYPVLASFIMPVLLYTNNKKDLKFSHFLLYIIAEGFVVCLFEYVLYKFMHISIQLSAVITFFAVVLFYTPFYRFKRIISGYWVQYVIKYIFYIVCAFLIYFIDGYVPLVLSILFFLMLLLYIFSSDKSVKDETNNVDKELNVGANGKYSDDLPDVYHIVYDMYSGLYSLDIAENYDNSLFYNELEKKGFKIYTNVFSNYIFTLSSVPSFMNMAYTFEYMPPRADNNYAFPFATNNLDKYIIESEVVTRFSNLGYKIFLDYEHRLDSESIKKSKNNNKDITALGKKDFRFINEFLFEIFKISIFSDIITYESHMHYIHRKLDDIANFPKLIDDSDKNLPYYFFIKVTFPHAPFVFGPNGEELVRFNKSWANYEEITDDNMNIMYLDNLKGCNPLILNSLDNLINNIKNNNRKSIILIHSDHGHMYGSNPSFIQKFNILYGIYTFGFNENDYKDYVPENFTLVNSMRYLFNFISNDNMELKADKYYDQDIKKMFEAQYIEYDVTQSLVDEIKEYMNDKKLKKI